VLEIFAFEKLAPPHHLNLLPVAARLRERRIAAREFVGTRQNNCPRRPVLGSIGGNCGDQRVFLCRLGGVLRGIATGVRRGGKRSNSARLNEPPER